MTTPLLIFDDSQGAFGPMTDLRPVFDLRTAMLTNRQRIEQTLGRPADALWVRGDIITAVATREPDRLINQMPSGDFLAVNGRWLGVYGTGPVKNLEPGEALVTASNELIALHADADLIRQILESDANNLQGQLSSLGVQSITLESHAIPMNQSADPLAARIMIDRPWHLLDALEATLAHDLSNLDWPTWHADGKVNSDTDGDMNGRGVDQSESEAAPLTDRLSPSEIARAHGAQATQPHAHLVTVYGQHPLYIQPDATLHPNVVINTEQGPVAIDSGATIHPFAVIQGPCYVGKNSVVQPHTNLRANTVIGPACKVGGEISFSIIHGYSNKAHAGYLGHSLVGRWVNLGGDTNVSNLKNTYGDVRVQLEKDDPAENTGRTFVGPIIGDFVRTAIGTRIPTGACISTGAMLALSDFAPKFVERFAFLTDTKADTADMDKFIDMARKVVERRCCGLKPEEEDLLCRTAGVKAKRMRDSA